MKKKYILKKILIFSLFFSINETISKPPYSKEELIELIESFSNPHIRLFLALIACSEGTKYPKLKKIAINPTKLKEYKFNFLCSINHNLEKHPNQIKYCKKKKLCSSASGRYQFLKKTDDWIESLHRNFHQLYDDPDIKKPIHKIYKNIDSFYEEGRMIYPSIKDLTEKRFGPFWQDLKAISLLNEKEVLSSLNKPISEKKLIKIIFALAKTWASFPTEEGHSQYKNQPSQRLKDLIKIYNSLKKNSLDQFKEEII